MKFLLQILPLLALLAGTALSAEEASKPATEPAAAPSQSSQNLLDLCPKDMPPACACVAHGDAVQIMPANEAYKARKKVLLVGPTT